jgi:hypothetical protein
MDRYRDKEAIAPKLVFVYPLRADAGKLLRSQTAPTFLPVNEERE